MPTSVSVSATVTVSGKKVVIDAGSIENLGKNGVVFSISEPVDLGPIDSFIEWLATTFGHEGNLSPTKADTKPESLPQALWDAYLKLEGAHVVLDTLSLDQPHRTYKVGVSLHVPDPGIEVGIPGLAFDGVGVVVTRTDKTTTLQEKIDATTTTLKLKDATVFADASNVAVVTRLAVGTDGTREEMSVEKGTKLVNGTLTVKRGKPPQAQEHDQDAVVIGW